MKVGRFTVTLLFFTTPEVNPAASEIKFPKALKDPFKTLDIHHLEVHPTFIELLSIQTKKIEAFTGNKAVCAKMMSGRRAI